MCKLKNERPKSHSPAKKKAFAESEFPSKALKAESTLQLMLDSYHIVSNLQAKPSVITYSAIMNTFAYTKGNLDDRSAAFWLAQTCLNQVLNSSRSGIDDNGHNNIVLRTFLHACTNLVPPGQKHNKLVTSVFEECCRWSMVDMKIVFNLRLEFSNDLSNSNSKSILAKHFSHGRIEFEDLPLD